jgi:glycosyltransferase involved in cell wall biosynthesis
MLIIVATHPIQYQVPIWKELARRLNVKFEVWYLTSHGVRPTVDIQFGKEIIWDIDLLDGYSYRFSEVHCPKQLTDFWSAKLPRDFKSSLKDNKITHILITGWNVRAFIEVALIAWKHGKKLWIRAESNDLKKNSRFKNILKNIFLNFFFLNIDKFLFIGKANKRFYESFGVKEEQLFFAPYCVDNKRFAMQAKKNEENRDIFRKNWKIDKNSFCILFAGKLMEKKNPKDIIEAVKILNQKNVQKQYHILYVGTGELYEELKENSNVVFDCNNKIDIQTNNDSLPLSSFTGFINQSKISEAYIAADLLVLPSNADETWGLVVNEAMISGLPCIVSDACGSAEDLVKAINTAFIYPLGDTYSLANSISNASKNLPSKTQLKFIIDSFDYIHTVDTLEKLWLNSISN